MAGVTDAMDQGAPGLRQLRNKRPLYARPLVWVQVVLVLGLVVGAWLSLRSNLADPVLAAPSHVGDMKRVDLVTGDAAIQQMQQMHLGDIGIMDGYVATYQSSGETMTLWVGVAANQSDTVGLLDRMVLAIGKGGTPFSSPVSAAIAGRQMFSTSGAGGMNYFFVSGRSVVWVLLTRSAAPEKRVEDVLNTVKFE